MRRRKQIEQLAKLTAYILGRQPDEFGLVPDTEGYVKTKEFLKAINETKGWKHIRQSHINEMLLVLNNPPVELKQNKIRARDRSRLPKAAYCKTPPKVLYTFITQKSYPTVIDKGVMPTTCPHVICTLNKDMAERIGRRRDNHPVLLTVQVGKAADMGVKFHQAGEGLFLTGFIPPGCFIGPPLPKQPESVKKAEPLEAYKQKTMTGSFTLSAGNQKMRKNGRKKREGTDWKKNKKRLRKEKKQPWPD